MLTLVSILCAALAMALLIVGLALKGTQNELDKSSDEMFECIRQEEDIRRLYADEQRLNRDLVVALDEAKCQVTVLEQELSVVTCALDTYREE